MRVEIFRVEKSVVGVFGIMCLNGEAFCVTLEDPDLTNQRNISCIPAGRYKCKKHTSPKFGETFIVQRVKDRSGILFHWGNFAGLGELDHTQGCILVAQFFATISNQRGIGNSKAVFKEFRNKVYALMEEECIDTFDLEIYDVRKMI